MTKWLTSISEFITLFPVTDNKTLAERYGTTVPAVKSQAYALGLTKTPETISRINTAALTGRRVSEETRAKLSTRFRGRVMSDEQKRKLSAVHKASSRHPRGENHYRWKGGPKADSPRINDPAYRAWRRAVLERDDFMCQRCGKQGNKHGHGLHAHHKQAWVSTPELRFNVDNGQTLCRRCHLTEHGRARRYEVVLCACGCGQERAGYDMNNRRRYYIRGHYSRWKHR